MKSKFSGEEAFRFLESLAFERFAGTEGENLAAERIANYLKDFGLAVAIEEFEVMTYKIKEAKVIVNGKEIECSGVGLSKDTGDEGVEGELIFTEDYSIKFLKKAKDKIVVYYGRFDFEVFRKLVELGVKGIIRVESSPGREPSRTDIMTSWWKYGNIPMVRIRYEDALYLQRCKPEKVKLILKQEIMKSKSKNIIGIMEGKEYPDEVILVGAHYDSERETIGACDNLSGTAILLELAKVFSGEEVKRTLNFAFFGAEELGLVGSRDYVERHKEELEKIKLMVNLDVHGQALGTYSCIVTGPDEIKHYVEFLSKEIGIRINTSSDIMSSDSISFASKGIPSVSFFRGGGSSYFAHTPLDSLEYIAPIALENMGVIVETFVRRVANSEEFPFKREVPEQIKKKIKDYFEKRLGMKLDY